MSRPKTSVERLVEQTNRRYYLEKMIKTAHAIAGYGSAVIVLSITIGTAVGLIQWKIIPWKYWKQHKFIQSISAK